MVDHGLEREREGDRMAVRRTAEEGRDRRGGRLQRRDLWEKNAIREFAGK